MMDVKARLAPSLGSFRALALQGLPAPLFDGWSSYCVPVYMEGCREACTGLWCSMLIRDKLILSGSYFSRTWHHSYIAVWRSQVRRELHPSTTCRGRHALSSHRKHNCFNLNSILHLKTEKGCRNPGADWTRSKERPSQLMGLTSGKTSSEINQK